MTGGRMARTGPPHAFGAAPGASRCNSARIRVGIDSGRRRAALIRFLVRCNGDAVDQMTHRGLRFSFVWPMVRGPVRAHPIRVMGRVRHWTRPPTACQPTAKTNQSVTNPLHQQGTRACPVFPRPRSAPTPGAPRPQSQVTRARCQVPDGD